MVVPSILVGSFTGMVGSVYWVTVSPESTRPATRRSLREKSRAHTGPASEPTAASADTTPAGTAIITTTPFSGDTGAVDAIDGTPTPEQGAPGLADAAPDAVAEPTALADEPSDLLDDPTAPVRVIPDAGAARAAASPSGDGLPPAEALADPRLLGAEDAVAVPPVDDSASPAIGDLFGVPVQPDAPALFDEPAPVTAEEPSPLFLSDIENALAAEAETTEVSEPEVEAQPAQVTAWADDRHPITALTWVDPLKVGATPSAQPETAPALFAGARLAPTGRRLRLVLPLGIIGALCASYVGGTLLAPLDNVAPAVQNAPVEIAAAPAATVTWPATGSAAVAVLGMNPVASTTDRDQIASLSKVASVMMVLDKLPLKVGEQGPSYAFTKADQRDFLDYRRSNQSSLDVPVGGSLTEYQILQGVLLGSANNYIDRLAREIWGSEAAFADASAKWLRDNGIEGITLENPSGFSKSNVATPEAMLRLSELAMRNPVFAEIVATRTAEIPGVGTVTNTNKMLDDPGVIGIKTGTLDHWNLLTAKEVKVGDTTVRLFTSVLGQDSSKDRLAVTRELLAGMEKSLADQPVSVPKGTVVGKVTTEWGGEVNLVTDSDVRVVLWNGATATATSDLALGSKTTAGAKAGTLSAKGPVNTAETTVSLAKEVTAPSIWWRLTHPLELFGIDKQ